MPATTPDRAPAPRRLAVLCALLLVVATLALNQRVVGFGFLNLRDDDINLTVNAYMGGLSWDRLRWMFTDTAFARRYIPLGWLSFSAVYEWAGLDPGPYHALGLGLAALDAALVFAVVRSALRRFSAPGRADTAWSVGAAALAAGWWAFHPLRVENTAWVSGNLYGLALTFLLLALWPYLASGRAEGRRRRRLIAGAAVAFTASLLVYPIALLVPVLLAGLDAVPPPGGPRVPFRQLLGEKLLFLLPLGGVLAVTIGARFAGASLFGKVPSLHDATLLARGAQCAYVAAYYLWKPWWPFGLSPIYDTLVNFNPAGPVFVASMAAVLAVSAAALAAWRRVPLFAVVWFGYLIVMLPYYGLTEQPHWACDRYAVLPTLLVAVLLAALLNRLRAPGPRLAAASLMLGLTGGLGILTWRQQEIWRTDDIHLRYTTASLPPGPTHESVKARLLLLEFMLGDEAAASQAIAEGIVRHPDIPDYKHSADLILEKRKVEAYYGAACFLAIIQERTGVEFTKLGQDREANDHLEYALRLDDTFYQAAYNRAFVLLRLGRPRDALDSFLVAERWGGAGLSALQRHNFFDQLRHAADPALAQAAARAEDR